MTHVVVVSDRSLAMGDDRMRRSARLLAELAGAVPVRAFTRVAAHEAGGIVSLGDGFTEHRVPRTAAERDWHALRVGRYGIEGGDDALTFDRAPALNPALRDAVSGALRGALAAVCVRPYAFGFVRALWDGPVLYDALELEYPLRAHAPSRPPNRVALLEEVAAIEQRCVDGAAAVLTSGAQNAALCGALYAAEPRRVLGLPAGFDARTQGPATAAARRARKDATSLRGRTYGLYAGDATPRDVRDVFALCRIAQVLPDVSFIVAGRVAAVLPAIALPPNVQCTGVVDDATAGALYDAADFFVMPGEPREHPARSLLDAISHNAPLVAARGAAGAAFADGRDGEIDEADRLPERIRTLVADPARGERCAAAARVTAAREYALRATLAPLFDLLAALRSPATA